MKTVTIPTCANPFVVIVNGIKYTYPAGATVEVPDDVAAVIEQHDEAHNNPAPAPVVPPFTPATSAGDASDEVVDFSGVFDFATSIGAGGAEQTVYFEGAPEFAERLKKGPAKVRLSISGIIAEAFVNATIVGTGESQIVSVVALAELNGTVLYLQARAVGMYVNYKCMSVPTQPYVPSQGG